LATEPTPVASVARRLRPVTLVALTLVVVGVFSTWTEAGPVTLNGIEGPHDGWLVLILAAASVAWARMMERSSWSGAIGVAGVLGASLAIAWTALGSWAENRDVLDASVGHGLVLVVAAAAVLAAVAALRGVELARARRHG
jgi:hypothetical protein